MRNNFLGVKMITVAVGIALTGGVSICRHMSIKGSSANPIVETRCKPLVNEY